MREVSFIGVDLAEQVFQLHGTTTGGEVVFRKKPSLAIVDRDYRVHGVETTKVLISGTRKGVTPSLAKLLRRRSAIEPEIGHMNSDGRLARCPLTGTIGNAIFALLCGCGHNIRKILAHIRALITAIMAAVLAALRPGNQPPYAEACA